MGNPVVMNSVCMCTLGAAPCPLVVTSQQQCMMGGVPAATVMEKLLPSFGVCNLTVPPTPCVPAVLSWLPGCATVMVGGKPLLNNTSKGVCARGGMISVVMTPAMTIKTP